ncbi:MAG: peptidylprolyl isomerase [Bacteroidetes bacterium]|nr:peptidylprolyl isomerase [Bacteroidota bacterium]
MKRSLIYICMLMLMVALSHTAYAQYTTADRVVAVVGDNIVLQSEVDIQLNQQLHNANPNPIDTEETRCRIFDGLLLDKMFLAQANLDSLTVSQEEIEAELDRRVKYFISIFDGSKEKMEAYYGKSVAEMKEDFTEDIKNQLLSDKMKGKVFTGLKVSPQEVYEFFAKIPKDSIPYFNSELEIGQVIMFPKVTEEEKEVAKKKLEKIKKDIEGGADFSLQAILYSEDPGSASNGGDLGIIERGELVPEFEAVAYRLDPHKMSDIVETPFGYHLILLDEKRGNKLKLRHILIKPKTTLDDLEAVKKRIDSVQHQLVADSMSFREAVNQYSDDENLRMNGGLMTNPKTQSTFFEKSEIDGTLIFTLDRMKVGQYSEVLPFTSMDKTGQERKGYRIIYLKSETKPHKADPSTDYSKIQAAAKQKKQQDELAHWIRLNKGHVFIKIDKSYYGCDVIKKWLSTDNGAVK